MGSGKERPLDRPAKIWCSVCQDWADMRPRTASCGNFWPPQDLRKWRHGPCGAQNSMTYVYDDAPPASPQSLRRTKPLPHCGDASCIGLCSDPLCIPADPEQAGAGGSGLFWVFFWVSAILAAAHLVRFFI